MRAKDASPCFVGQSTGTDVAPSQTGADGIDSEADVKEEEGRCVADEDGGSKDGLWMLHYCVGKDGLSGREGDSEIFLPLNFPLSRKTLAYLDLFQGYPALVHICKVFDHYCVHPRAVPGPLKDNIPDCSC